MTMVLPCRLITRQRSHMGLTEARTFICFLSVSVGDAAAGQVVRRQLDLHLVAGEDADVVLAHLSGDGGEDGMTAVDLHPEHRARERLGDLAFDLDLLFFVRQFAFLLRARKHGRGGPPRASYGSKPAFAGVLAWVRIRAGPSWTATVCSKCADVEPSIVEIDHSSSWRYTSGPPAVIIGSIASVMPVCSNGPLPGSPKF